MSWNNVRRRQTDILFSRYLRHKNAKEHELNNHFGGKYGVCVKCKQWKEINLLQVSHFHSRKKESTRFDEENCDVLCAKCHDWFEHHKTEYEVWKINNIPGGAYAFARLTLRANQVRKRDDTLVKMWLKTLEGYPWKA